MNRPIRDMYGVSYIMRPETSLRKGTDAYVYEIRTKEFITMFRFKFQSVSNMLFLAACKLCLIAACVTFTSTLMRTYSNPSQTPMSMMFVWYVLMVPSTCWLLIWTVGCKDVYAKYVLNKECSGDWSPELSNVEVVRRVLSEIALEKLALEKGVFENRLINNRRRDVLRDRFARLSKAAQAIGLLPNDLDWKEFCADTFGLRPPAKEPTEAESRNMDLALKRTYERDEYDL